jgi:hypothetical protein
VRALVVGRVVVEQRALRAVQLDRRASSIELMTIPMNRLKIRNDATRT